MATQMDIGKLNFIVFSTILVQLLTHNRSLKCPSFYCMGNNVFEIVFCASTFDMFKIRFFQDYQI